MSVSLPLSAVSVALEQSLADDRVRTDAGAGTDLCNPGVVWTAEPAKLQTQLGMPDRSLFEYEVNLYGDYDSRNHALTVPLFGSANSKLYNYDRLCNHTDEEVFRMYLTQNLNTTPKGLNNGGLDIQARMPVAGGVYTEVEQFQRFQPYYSIKQDLWGRGYSGPTPGGAIDLRERAPVSDGGPDKIVVREDGAGTGAANAVHPLSMQMMAYGSNTSSRRAYANLDPNSMALLKREFVSLLSSGHADVSGTYDPNKDPNKE